MSRASLCGSSGLRRTGAGAVTVRQVVWALVLGFVLAGLPPWACAEVSPQEEFEQALSVLERQAAYLRSRPVEYQYSWQQKVSVTESGQPETTAFSCRLVTLGAKFRYERQVEFVTPEGPTLQEIGTYDGVECRTHFPRTRKGSIASRPHLPFPPLQLAYQIGRGDVPAFLGGRAGTATISRERRDRGSPLLVVAFSVEDQSYTVSLDPDVGYQPVSVSIVGTGHPEAVEATGIVSDLVTSRVTRFQKVQDVFVPAAAELVFQMTNAKGETQVHTERSYSLQSVAFDVAADDSVFSIEFPEGTKVTLADTGELYTVGSE